MDTIRIPEILLPKSADMTLWAVNACDQFTSDKNYWSYLDKLVGSNVSALRLIFPEIYLNDNPEMRIAEINRAMRDYIDSGVFKEVSGGFILVERKTQSGTRTGIVLSIDLEDYSFERGAKTPVRSTEATILERIPPRVKIREDAPVELPHVMLLYDDRKSSVLNCVRRGCVLYDFTLNMGGGSVKGTFIENAEEVKNRFYSLAEKTNFLFAVGDGNHSLAAAKACWDNIKDKLTDNEREVHPARFALCEAVNIYDDALCFEPIHRLVKTRETEKFISGLQTCGGKNAYLLCGGKKTEIPFSDNVPEGIRLLDKYVNTFIAENGGEVDYIHGIDELEKFTAEGGLGVALPAIGKEDFFALIASGGNLPRKTFSMGEGNEKRYYIEAKKIK